MQYSDEKYEGWTFCLCKAESDVYVQCFGFMAMGSVYELVASGSQEFAAKWEAAKRNKVQSAPLSFKPAAVTTVTCYQFEIERRATILNTQEYQKLFGHPPRVKQTRWLPTLMVPKEKRERVDGGVDREQVWLFSYSPSSPHRSIAIKQFTGTMANCSLMPESAHMYEDQANDVMAWHAAQQKLDHEVHATGQVEFHSQLCRSFLSLDSFGRRLSGTVSDGSEAADSDASDQEEKDEATEPASELQDDAADAASVFSGSASGTTITPPMTLHQLR